MTDEFDFFVPHDFTNEPSEYSQPIDEDCSSGEIPEDATVTGSLTEDGKRRILVSEVTTVNKPFFDKNRAMMTRYINDRLRDGSMARIVPFAFTTRHITYLQRNYKRVNFWRVDRTQFIADVEVHLNLDTQEGVREWVGIMTLWGNIEHGFACTIEDFVDIDSFDQRDMIPLSSFLIPIFANRQMDHEMELVWSHNKPEALTDPSVRSARDLAARMGLSIVSLPVHAHPNTPTILFFVDDTILVSDSDYKKPQKVQVAANTIVINTNHRYSDFAEYYIFHECVHYEEHYMFFKLQELHTNDILRMKTRVQVVEAGEKITSPLYWMEVQANRGAYGLMEADRNPQLMLYALAELLEFDPLYDIRTIRMSIVQPRLNNTSSYEISPDALLAWAQNEVAPAAMLAMEGNTNIYKTTLLGISDLEKAMGRKAFQEIVSPYVFKPEGTPELVPLSDRRKPLSSSQTDFAE